MPLVIAPVDHAHILVGPTRDTASLGFSGTAAVFDPLPDVFRSQLLDVEVDPGEFGFCCVWHGLSILTSLSRFGSPLSGHSFDLLGVQLVPIAPRIPTHAFLDVEEPAKQDSSRFWAEVVGDLACDTVHDVLLCARAISQILKSVLGNRSE